MLEVSRYDLQAYGEMIADHGRMDPYLEALRRTVGPGSVVLDLGAGLGAFAVVACRLGARRVYAVEPNEVIEISRQIASANGCADRIQFFRQTSDTLVLPERATIMVSDLRGALPLYEHHLPSIIDARQRLLDPAGVLIPQRDVILATLCEFQDSRGKFTDPWEENKYELDLSAAKPLVRNAWRVDRLDRVNPLADTRPCLTLDYRVIDSPHARGEVEWRVTKAGTAHGFGLWFDTMLVPGVGFTNAPGSGVGSYGHAFFPFEDSVEVEPDDLVTLILQADLVESSYVWRWRTRFFEDARHRVKAEFDQSSLLGIPLTLEQLRRTATSFVPTLGEDGRIDRMILDDLLAGRQLGEAAQHTAEVFSGRFGSAEEALPHVVRLAMRYGIS
jgi:protein arginine N-methyltransferase 1